jgi:hypothetical protein
VVNDQDWLTQSVSQYHHLHHPTLGVGSLSSVIKLRKKLFPVIVSEAIQLQTACWIALGFAFAW